jgi:tetratricopeptide (TPR) repeat protein
MVVLGVAAPLWAAEADPDVEIAQRHFAMGREYYATSDYQRALDEFEAARKIKPLPAFDFNIARCYDRMERFAEARAAYQRYVSSSPTPEDADEVRRRIEVLDERISKSPPATLEPSPAPAALAPPSAKAPTGRGTKIGGAILAALGVASLATGIGFSVLAHQSGEELSKLDRATPKVMFDPQKEQAGKTDQIVADVMLSVGAVAAVVGTVVALVGRRAEKRVRLTASAVEVRF